jgi:hypothetical protein
MEYKQHNADKGIVRALPSDLLSRAIKRSNKMAEIKIGLMIAYLIGIPISVFSFIANLDTWKSTALFIMVMIYWMGMIWFGFRTKSRREKKEKMELRKQELDLWHEEEKVNNKKNGIKQ